ncbi:type II toxin-antitoxin system Phd/YefM family antitoxin [Clostridiaceae bacterium]|nr:type II toxin-antitoxin system Phd/YefM family antitoxin [Clostridiaceae bacterium]
MAFTTDLLQSLVPITQFNRGQASRIFDRLHSERQLIVLKNNQPSAIILSPEEYARLAEIEEDYTLLLEANKRLEENHEKPALSFQSVLDDFGLSEADLEETEDMPINDLAD